MRHRLLSLVLLCAVALGTAAAVHAFWLRQPLPRPLRNPEIQVFKARRQLELRADGQVVRVYRIGLGTTPVGPKRRQGDRRTPEGKYFICNKNPRSQFYLSLQVSYPNEEDADRGLVDGVIQPADHERIVSASRRRGIPPAGTRLGGEIDRSVRQTDVRSHRTFGRRHRTDGACHRTFGRHRRTDSGGSSPFGGDIRRLG